MVLVAWRGVDDKGEKWQPTWEPKNKSYAKALAEYRASKSAAQADTIIDAIQLSSSATNATLCVICKEGDGVGRQCARCNRSIHHFCSDELRESLGLDESIFGNSCYCSQKCVEGKTSATIPNKILVRRKAKESQKSTQVTTAESSVEVVPSVDIAGQEEATDVANFTHDLEDDTRPGRELTREEIVSTRRRVAYLPSTETTWLLPIDVFEKTGSKYVFGVVVKPPKPKEGETKSKRKAKPGKEIPDPLDIRIRLTTTEFKDLTFRIPLKKVRQGIATFDLLNDVVGKFVSFSPKRELWMIAGKGASVYEDVGSMYLVGVVSRSQSRTLTRVEMYQVRWTTTSLQSTSAVHHIPIEKVLEGIEQFKRMNGSTMGSDSWSALCKPHTQASIADNIWDDYEEIEESNRRYERPFQAPTNLREVESLESMQFHPNATLSAPDDVYSHSDGSHITRLKPRFKHIFEHSASSSFFAFLPVAFWQRVVETTNNYGVNDKQPAVTIDEMMRFLGILFYMTLVDKGEVANHWGEQVENQIFNGTSISMDHIMTLKRFKHIRRNLCFRNDVGLDDLKSDPAARIRPLLNVIKLRGMKYVDLGRNVAVDETSIACRSKFGRHMILFNSTKPTGKYHFKIYMCCCSTSWLAINYRLHCASDVSERLRDVADDQSAESVALALELSEKIRTYVLEVTYPLYSSRRIVNTDNYYTSCQLLEALKVNGLYCRGTIRENSKHAPKCFMLSKKDNLPRGSMRQGVDIQNKIVAASWLDGNVVNIVSNADGSSVTTVTRAIGQRKVKFDAPTCVREYNKAMQGVDRLDQLRGRFSIADGHSFRKWHKKLAMAFIDIARVNAFICRKMAGGTSRDPHRQFMTELISDLLNGSWKDAVGDAGLLFDDPRPTTTPLSTPSKQMPPSTPSKSVPECEAMNSKQVFEKQRTRRECVVCRFEGRPPTVTTTFCISHNVSLCLTVYDRVSGNHTAPEQDKTCWQKYHEYYMPRGLFNANGNIRRSSAMFKASKGRFASFDTQASFPSRLSTDYSGSPLLVQSPHNEESKEATV